MSLASAIHRAHRSRRAQRRTARTSLLAALLASVVVTGGVGVAGPVSAAPSAPVPHPLAVAPAAAADPCGPDGSTIACENSRPGTPPSEWDGIFGAGSEDIQGFATEMSVDVGGSVDFKVDTAAPDYDVTIYRTGWYGGDGAREVATIEPSAPLPQRQPECLGDVSTGLTDCGNWGVSATWDVPASAVSGVYLARLEVPSTGAASHITFVVRDDDAAADVVFQTSDTTWQAYNTYGLGSFYEGINGRAQKISYNRPMLTRGGPGGRDYYLSNEYPMVRFLERNGYDVSYLSGVDAHRSGSLLLDHEVYLSVGHDEYWSAAQRSNVEAARDAGVDLQFLSGNEVYWKTRMEPSIDGTATSDRTLVTYKETASNGRTDPSGEWTGTWRDPRFAPRSSGAGRAENGLTGTAYVSNFSDLPLTVDAREGKLRLWRDTALAALAPGASRELAPHTVGYESDEDLDNGERPPGLVRLSTTTGDVPEYLVDYGNTVVPGSTRHHVTLYRAESGALVFGAGTVQWTWGLDTEHDSSYSNLRTDPAMQQAQVNLLADMGAQPATLMGSLARASASTDTQGPTAAIASPGPDTAVSNGEEVTLTGSAQDVGGRVAGVEVSTDGGASWSAADGTVDWTFSYVQHGNGPTSTLVRAIDDSANLGTAVSLPLRASCPCSVYGVGEPPVPATDDPSAAELGLRFSPTVDGFVSGVRFSRGPGNGGTHVGTLWSSAGEQLASATFTSESGGGWQQVDFDVPVAVSSGQTYVVSYTAPQGHYAVEPWAFARGPLLADPLEVAGGFGVPDAGVYAAPGEFPTRSYQNASYFVDPVFTTTDDSPLTATQQWPLPGSSSVPADTLPSARFSKPMQPGSVDVVLRDGLDQRVAGSTSFDAATRTVTFTPDQPLDGFVRHTVTLQGTDQQGQSLAGGGTWSFTTVKPAGEPGVCPCTLFDDATIPTLLQDVDTVPVTLGVRFSSEVDGTVTGVRFYKGPDNTGAHVGSLWTVGGAELAQGTFSDESSSGWQTLTFDDPVVIQAGQQYVASYRAPRGRYSASPNAFAQNDLSRSPLQVDASAGAYTYADGFPDRSSATSYLVDLVFEREVSTFEVEATDPPDGSLDVARNAEPRLRMTQAIDSGWSMDVTDASGSPVPGTASLTAGGTDLVFTPDGPMPASETVDVVVSGLRAAQGGSSAPDVAWSFTTRGPSSASAQSLFTDQVPQVAAADDSAPVELGTAFSPSRDGEVTGIRFLKGPGNLGVHTGSLWGDTGNRLAQVRFVGESGSGWQSAMLSTPVEVQAGSTYVVSYHAPQGHYSYTGGFFGSPFSHGDLTAPAGANGRYLYGDGGYPVHSWGSTNYFVDVVFEAEPAAATITDQQPAPGDTEVSRSAEPSVTISSAVADGWELSVRVDGAAIAGTAVRSADGRTLSFVPDAPLPADSTATVLMGGVTTTDGASVPDASWSFTTTGSTVTRLLEGETPETVAADDGSSIELGMGFVPSVDGSVTALRFFKGPGNTGTHLGSVWSADGARLATVTFAGESPSGWQRAVLDQPVPVSAGEEYVVSYVAPNGHYSVTPRYFSAPRVVGPLSAGTENSRYRYGDGSEVPTGVFRSTNYFVDLDFRADAS